MTRKNSLITARLWPSKDLDDSSKTATGMPASRILMGVQKREGVIKCIAMHKDTNARVKSFSFSADECMQRNFKNVAFQATYQFG